MIFRRRQDDTDPEPPPLFGPEARPAAVPPEAGPAAVPPAAPPHGPREPQPLVPFAEHRKDVLARIRPLEPIELGILDAQGCVLAQEAVAVSDLPPFPNSAMDGYALLAMDAVPGAELALVGESAAGSPARTPVGRGQAVRIMTGAPMPPGADAVVPVEQAEEWPGVVRLAAGAEPGQHVRMAGEDVRHGEVVLSSGRVLAPADIGMLAALGYPRVLVRPQPRVVVISTGDELVEPEEPTGLGQIRDANSYTLTAMARDAGASAYRHQIVRDDERALTEAFEGALVHADLVVTSGGVSAGRYDLVKVVLARLGDVRFVRVGMRPGMPQAFGLLPREPDRAVPVFGLPGNPVSAFVSFEMFVRPAIRRLQGRTDTYRPRISAVLDEPLRSPREKVEFVRVRLRREGGAWHARPTGEQGSGILRSVVDADGLAEVPPERTQVAAGERLVVHLLERP
ncbi:MAG TPA: gephyrin-like molybdotransferase Glp [Egibacteraceae bacterium]|nr:gephyrin-like molybdotransferase Glp [Egibacteraceae bacterium]